jgi:hypothetical protein
VNDQHRTHKNRANTNKTVMNAQSQNVDSTLLSVNIKQAHKTPPKKKPAPLAGN